MKLNPLEFVMLLAIIICSALLIAGCSHTKVAPEKNCCQRLDVRTKEMQDFNRFCKVLVVARATNKDAQAQESIKNRLGVCRFVFGVSTNRELLSAVDSRHLPTMIEMGWQTPLDCDPSEPTCEEFWPERHQQIKMKTFIIATAIVVIGFMFGRAMHRTASYFLENLKRMNNKEEDQWKE